MNYEQLLSQLRNDISKLNLKRHKLKPSQKDMLDFIEAKSKSVQFFKNNTIHTLHRGGAKEGFEHILLRHYQEDSRGKLTAREVLNIGLSLDKGNIATDFEQTGKENIAYDFFNTQNIRLRITAYTDGLVKRIISYFSSRE